MVEQEADHLKGYRGRVIIVGSCADITYDAPPKGKIVGRDEDRCCYLVKLDVAANEHHADGSIDKLSVLIEDPDNLIKLRRPKNLLERRILEKGYEVGEYAFFWTTGEGHFLRGDFGRMRVESYSGSIITMEPKVFDFWLDWDKEKKRNDLVIWREVKLRQTWIRRSKELRNAIREVRFNPWKMPPEIFVGYKEKVD